MEIPESDFTWRIDVKPREPDRLLFSLVVAKSVLVASDRDFLDCLLISVLCSFVSAFQPNLYRLMQVRRQLLPIASKFDYLFSKSQKSNRVELVSDFPKGNDAEVISSLQVCWLNHCSQPVCQLDLFLTRRFIRKAGSRSRETTATTRAPNGRASMTFRRLTATTTSRRSQKFFRRTCLAAITRPTAAKRSQKSWPAITVIRRTKLAAPATSRTSIAPQIQIFKSIHLQTATMTTKVRAGTARTKMKSTSFRSKTNTRLCSDLRWSTPRRFWTYGPATSPTSSERDERWLSDPTAFIQESLRTRCATSADRISNRTAAECCITRPNRTRERASSRSSASATTGDSSARHMHAASDFSRSRKTARSSRMRFRRTAFPKDWTRSSSAPTTTPTSWFRRNSARERRYACRAVSVASWPGISRSRSDSSHASRANAERTGNFSQNQDFVLKSSEPKSSTLSRWNLCWNKNLNRIQSKINYRKWFSLYIIALLTSARLPLNEP